MFIIINNIAIKTKCRCECKELIDKGVCDKRLFGILVIVSVNVIKRVMLLDIDYENCNCRKKLVDKLIDECAETAEVKLAKITLAENKNTHKCNSCTFCIVLMIVVFTVCAGISTYFVHYNWSVVKNVSRIKFTRTQTAIY